jgi:hypothetical protein
MALNDEILAALGAASALGSCVAKVADLVEKDPAKATMPIGILWQQLGLTQKIPLVGTCLTILFLSFWGGNAMVKFTEAHKLPLPLDIVGVTKAMSYAGVPVSKTVAKLMRDQIAKSVGNSPKPEDLKRVFATQA